LRPGSATLQPRASYPRARVTVNKEYNLILKVTSSTHSIMTSYSKIYDQHRLRVDGLMGVATRERSERAHLPLLSTSLCFRLRQYATEALWLPVVRPAVC